MAQSPENATADTRMDPANLYHEDIFTDRKVGTIRRLTPVKTDGSTDPARKIIPAVERELIIRALIETKRNQVRAAKLLGITRATLRKRVEKYRIQRELQIS